MALVEELALTRVLHSYIGDAFVRGLSGEWPCQMTRGPAGCLTNWLAG